MTETEPEVSLREQIGRQMSAFLTPNQVQMLVEEILSVKKQVHADFSCKKCGQKQRALGEIADSRSVAAALKDLANQAFGNPVEQKVEPVFHVERNVYLVSGETKTELEHSEIDSESGTGDDEVV